MTARRHHYVPQCYLKGFVRHRDKPKLFVVAKERRSFQTTPANVAAERDFHTIEVEGLSPDTLENNFASFEAEVSRALERIIATRSLTNDDDRACLFNLMALMAVKNPRHRQNFASFHDQVVKRIMDMATATPERWEAQMCRAKVEGVIEQDADVDYQGMRDFVETDRYKVVPKTGWHLELELKSLEAVLPFFFNRKWMLFRARRAQQVLSPQIIRYV